MDWGCCDPGPGSKLLAGCSREILILPLKSGLKIILLNKSSQWMEQARQPSLTPDKQRAAGSSGQTWC